MAIADAYATNTQYKSIVTKTSGDNDSEIDAQCLAVSRYLDRRVNRKLGFNKDTAALTYLYNPAECAIGDLGRTDLLVELVTFDMAAAPTLIRIDEDRNGTFERTLASTDYEILPRNATRGPEARPYDRIRLLWSGTYTTWNRDSLVEVTVAGGWPALPQAIVQATCQLVGILRLESPRATSQMSAGLDTVLGASREAQDIVRQLAAVYGNRLVYA